MTNEKKPGLMIEKLDAETLKPMKGTTFAVFMLVKTNILQINGERGENEVYKEESVSFKLNPFIIKFFNAKIDMKE